jgi:hypothetical protein
MNLNLNGFGVSFFITRVLSVYVNGMSFKECCFVVSAVKGLQVNYDTRSRGRAIPTIVGMGGTDVQALGRAHSPARSGGVIWVRRLDWLRPGGVGI